MDINLRWHRKNSYSLAALYPLLENADIVRHPVDGIMVYSFSTAQKRSIFREVSSSKTDSVYIAGGPHPSGSVEETLGFFDYVVVGEGEETLPELVDTLLMGGDVSKVAGIAYKKDGKIVHTAARQPVNLDDYPCFDCDGPRSPIEISRGCPWNCKYCQTPRLFGHKMRHRSIDYIVRHASCYNSLRFTSSNAFAYGSDGIHPRLDKVEKLLASLAKLEGKYIYFGTFPSEVRPEFVTEDALELVDKYCTNKSISLGGQSGSDRILRQIRRGHSSEDIFHAVEHCVDQAIVPNVDFIFGFPGENEEDQRMTLDMINCIISKGGKVRAHYLTPLPSTPYENIVPAPIEPNVNKFLGKLALDGKLTGKWV
ncbi:TIGR04013 family B12-binding domain/radical SAM domain-containing protein [Methanohalophilus sp.]